MKIGIPTLCLLVALVLSSDAGKVKINKKTNYKKILEVEQKCSDVAATVDKLSEAIENLKGKSSPQSCAERKKCGGADTDGEYWLYPKVLNGTKVKVYCSEMNTDTPKEFITLPNTNFGDYPNTCNKHCKGETTSNCPGAAAVSHVEYKKIRIDLLSMEVDREDKTFATGTGKMLDYAKAADCYNIYYKPPTKDNLEACGPRGQFKIDSTGTGLKFSSSIVFTAGGWNGGQIIDWNDDGTVITGFCGGWCGWCTPDKITLEPNPKEVLLDEEATGASCNACC